MGSREVCRRPPLWLLGMWYWLSHSNAAGIWSFTRNATIAAYPQHRLSVPCQYPTFSKTTFCGYLRLSWSGAASSIMMATRYYKHILPVDSWYVGLHWTVRFEFGSYSLLSFHLPQGTPVRCWWCGSQNYHRISALENNKTACIDGASPGSTSHSRLACQHKGEKIKSMSTGGK